MPGIPSDTGNGCTASPSLASYEAEEESTCTTCAATENHRAVVGDGSHARQSPETAFGGECDGRGGAGLQIENGKSVIRRAGQERFHDRIAAAGTQVQPTCDLAFAGRVD